MLKTNELRKPDPRKEKFITTKAQGKICLRCMSWKNSTRVKRNILEVGELGKLDPHQDKFVTVETQSRM
ncbi:hypothetical protein B296_00042785 [Ensete ventricosum]|uniref:Uncharacterized protein n=1 Tax=Ensete ventricosum TaxID=4639 RepID=A0A426XX51_ENSVE|nr:hypothetical protein B296_00042785 [Ensete ventricosum]